MSGKENLMLFLTALVCFLTVPGCIEKNITCEDIKQANGYQYFHGCPTERKVYVDVHETRIAHGKPGDLSTHHYQHPDMRIGNSSFLTGNCSDLRIRCTAKEGGRVKDLCWDYSKMTGPEDTPDPSESQQGLIITASCVSVFLFVASILIFVLYRHRQRIREKGAAASRDSQGNFPNGNQGRGDAQMASEADNNINTTIEMEGENERNTLEEVIAQSTDPQAGETSDTEAKSGGTNVPDEVPNSRDMHRNQREDPGGVNGVKADDAVGSKKMQNGWTPGGRGPEDDEDDEKELLLSAQGHPSQHSDMVKGEAIALVDKSCSDPGLDSKYSVALDTDEKSAYYVKNTGINKY